MKHVITTMLCVLSTSCAEPPQPILIDVIPPPLVQKSTYSYLELIPTGRSNRYGNPIQQVVMYRNGLEMGRVEAVTGRSNTQHLDRNVPNREAPLPNGKYKVSTNWIPGAIPEAGSKFLPITPLFSTRRTELGFHVDPSYNKNKKEDGTAGCIGLTTEQNRDTLFRFVQQHKPLYLRVKI